MKTILEIKHTCSYCLKQCGNNASFAVHFSKCPARRKALAEVGETLHKPDRSFTRIKKTDYHKMLQLIATVIDINQNWQYQNLIGIHERTRKLKEALLPFLPDGELHHILYNEVKNGDRGNDL